MTIFVILFFLYGHTEKGEKLTKGTAFGLGVCGIILDFVTYHLINYVQSWN